MTWEEFIKLTALDCGLKSAARDFFIKVFTNETYIQLSREELAEECLLEFKTCTGHLTAIFKNVGKDKTFKAENRKLIDLYDHLQEKYKQRQSTEQRQAEARSTIPVFNHERLHLEIQRLNYDHQEAVFKQSIAGERAVQALLVRIDDLTLQKWLVWRLVQRLNQVEGIGTEKPIRIATKATRQWAAQPEEFWKWLAKDIACENTSPEAVLEQMAESCRVRSVVIVIYQVSQLKREFWEHFLEAFWQPLTARLNASPRSIKQRSCLLFLTESAKYQCSHSIPVLTELSAWEVVEREHMRGWLQNLEVQQFLEDATGKTVTQLEQDWLGEASLGEPSAVIRSLGQDVGLDDGIEEMKHHWNIGAA